MLIHIVHAQILGRIPGTDESEQCEATPSRALSRAAPIFPDEGPSRRAGRAVGSPNGDSWHSSFERNGRGNRKNADAVLRPDRGLPRLAGTYVASVPAPAEVRRLPV